MVWARPQRNEKIGDINMPNQVDGTNNTKEPEKREPEKKERDKKTTCLLVAAGIIILLLLLLLLRSCGTGPSPIVGPNNTGRPTFDMEVDPNAQKGSLEGKSKEEIQAALNEQVANGAINISMKLAPSFEDGTSEGDLLIVNDEINIYPQVVELYLIDTESETGLGDLLYKSGLIPVGSRVDSGKLLVDLDKGEYPCIAQFNAINEENGQLMGQARANVTVTIQN